MAKILYLISVLFLSQTLLAQAPDFTFSTRDSLFCNPSNVNFVSTVSGSPQGYIWNFGNGIISNDKNPSVTYANAGTYNVTLLVIYNQNTAQVSKTVTIRPGITATLAVDRDFICTAGDLNFTTSSSSSSPQYEWNFGDGSAIASTTANNISHRFSQMGSYEVTLKAISENGCSITKTTSVRMAPITASGNLTVDSGCVPATTTLNVYPNIPLNSSVASYEWDFNDGTPNSTTVANTINHTYTGVGSFQPFVKVTTNEGCETVLSYKVLGFGTPPTNHVASADKSVICATDSALFFANATDANNYLWDFGDGQTQFVKGNQVKHKYSSLGVKTVTVTPSYNRCYGTPVTFDIEVVGVIARFTYANTCADKKTFSFNNASAGNLSSIKWTINDGSADQFTPDIIHTFPQSGQFQTSLIIKDDITGCADTSNVQIYTAQAKLINPDTSICKNSSSTFKIENNFAGAASTYKWHVAGEVIGPISDQSVTVKTRFLGPWNNFVIINRGVQYCEDTINLDHSYVVRGPDLNFSAPNALCFGEPYQVVNSSKPARPQDSIKLWHWNYGVSSVNDSTYQPNPFNFPRAGTYPVKLQATDINGCTDSLIKNVLINPLPFLYTIPQIDTLCAGESATLIAFNAGVLDWKSTANIPCFDCDTIVVTPNVTSQYISTATSVAGCTKSDTLLIKVYSPFAANPTANKPFICLNEPVTLNVSPPDKIVDWTSSSGLSNSGAYEITTIPRETTTFTVTMRDSVGCFSSTADVLVTVKSLPEVDAGPDQVLPYNSNFTIRPTYSNNVVSYNWTPSNSLSCFSCPNPSGVLLESKQYSIEVLSDSGCVATDSINIIVECKDANILIPNAFTPNNDNLNDVFYPIARGFQSIRVFVIYDRYGKIVFERKNFAPNDPSMGWDGKRAGMDQTSNVYVYYIEAECYMGEVLRKKGSVTLLR